MKTTYTTPCRLCGKAILTIEGAMQLDLLEDADQSFDAGEFGGGSLVFHDGEGNAHYCECPFANLTMKVYRICDEDHIAGRYVFLIDEDGEKQNELMMKTAAELIFNPDFYDRYASGETEDFYH